MYYGEPPPKPQAIKISRIFPGNLASHLSMRQYARIVHAVARHEWEEVRFALDSPLEGAVTRIALDRLLHHLYLRAYAIVFSSGARFAKALRIFDGFGDGAGLDLWFERVVKGRLRGEAQLVRYIDDFVICFQYRSDAIRVQDALRLRLGTFGLTLEPTKTKLVEFGRFAQKHASKRGRFPRAREAVKIQ